MIAALLLLAILSVPGEPHPEAGHRLLSLFEMKILFLSILLTLFGLGCQAPQDTEAPLEEARDESRKRPPPGTTREEAAPTTDRLGGHSRVKKPMTPVSILTLLARPSDFEGRRVSVGGFFVFGFEETKLCFSEQVVRYYLPGNCLWLEFDWEALESAQLPTNKSLLEELHRWSLRHVLVSGTFAGGPQGHLEMSDGAIKSVDLMSLIEEREFEVNPPPPVK